MGSGASRPGAAANPRAVYTDTRAKREQQNLHLDAPVLVDVQHGSIRYRYSQKDQNANVTSRTEKPFEGDDTCKKSDYFYHTRLQHLGKDASYDKENNWKFYYVSKGPKRANQKQVFYVFGKGDLTAQDGKVTRSSEVKDSETDFTWPSEYKLARQTDVFYSIEFPQGVVNCSDRGDLMVEDLDSTADKSLIELTLKGEDTCEDLKRRIAVKILKAAGNIHIFHKGLELRKEDVIGDFRAEESRDAPMFRLNLKLLL